MRRNRKIDGVRSRRGMGANIVNQKFVKMITFKSLVECVFNYKRGIVIGWRSADNWYLLRFKDGKTDWYPEWSLRLLQ